MSFRSSARARTGLAMLTSVLAILALGHARSDERASPGSFAAPAPSRPAATVPAEAPGRSVAPPAPFLPL